MQERPLAARGVDGGAPGSHNAGERLKLHASLAEAFDELSPAVVVLDADQRLVRLNPRLTGGFPDLMVARPGDDEFAVVVPGIISESHAHHVAAQICGALPQWSWRIGTP